MRIYFLLAMAVGASFIGANCGGDGVGDPCTPEDEYLTGFSGFSQSEVNVESRSFQCLTRVCLVNHFQGRVSCPYGQVEDPEAPDSGLATCMGTAEHRQSAECLPGGTLHRASCQVPDRDGARWEDRIIPPVLPQLRERRAEDTVYCSCRCAGPDSDADYCDCPSGFDCRQLVDDLGIGREQLAGSYCVKANTVYNPGFPASEVCGAEGDPSERCDNRYNVTINDVTVGTNQKTGSCLPSGAECGKDDTCCGSPQADECIDKDGEAQGRGVRNCNGVCVGNQCDNNPNTDSEGLETIWRFEPTACDGRCP